MQALFLFHIYSTLRRGGLYVEVYFAEKKQTLACVLTHDHHIFINHTSVPTGEAIVIQSHESLGFPEVSASRRCQLSEFYKR